MPMFVLWCDKCKTSSRRISPRWSEVDKACGQCGGPLTRDYQPPTDRSVEVLDNGIMGRSLERPIDIEQMVKERASNDPRITRHEGMGLILPTPDKRG